MMKTKDTVRKDSTTEKMTVVPMRVDRELWAEVGRIVDANPFLAKVDIARIAMRMGVKQLREGATIALAPITQKEKHEAEGSSK